MNLSELIVGNVTVPGAAGCWMYDDGMRCQSFSYDTQLIALVMIGALSAWSLQFGYLDSKPNYIIRPQAAGELLVKVQHGGEVSRDCLCGPQYCCC